MNQTAASVNVSLPAQPIGENEAIPSRKVLRSWLVDLSAKTTVLPIVLLVIDLIIYGALMYFAITTSNIVLRLVVSVLMGLWIGRIFVLGHDACHQAYTPNKTLNKWLGRIAFLPSLSTYSLWDVGHNVIHHGFTNLKGVDFVWEPKTLAEYQAMSPTRQFFERLYRNGWNPWLYYTIEIWWNKMFWPNKKHIPAHRPAYFWDNVLVSVYAVIWLAVVVAIAQSAGVSVFGAVITGFILPFLVWNGLIGAVVWMHHTHERIQWYDDKKEWLAAQPFVTTTVHMTYKYGFGPFVHNIMEHTAHHLDATIPLYKLKETQARMEELLPNRIVVQAFSWSWYFRTARITKLYDFERQCWTDFAGNPTV